MKYIASWLLLLLVWIPSRSHAQGKYLTHNGLVTFFSASILEDIEAKSQEVSAVLDLNARQVAFSIPIRSFQFARTLMQEHFNENYMESERYPKATYAGKITDLNLDALSAGASQSVTTEGDLTLHGVTRHVTIPGTLQIQQGHLLVHAFFTVAPADYKIEIPALVREHIAKTVSVKVTLTADQVGLQALSHP